MKSFISIFCYIVCVYGLYPITPQPPVRNQNEVSSNSKVCTYGPTYWCKNITTAASCKATKHCIQTVWEHQVLPPDTSSVCQTCLEMVKEARDQLQSNETEEEIKEVFEGSCKLIPVKVVAEACIKVADEFIVELVDALASQMNPQIVCSIAGLCNNEQVHQQLEAMPISAPALVLKRKPDTCKACRTVISLLENKFEQASRDSILKQFLLVCGRIGSLSDACSSIIVKYFDDIYMHLEQNLNPDEVCLMSGECSAMFHTHISDIEVRPLSDVGVVRIGETNDDLPCDLCKQLVQHLRDILVANTTEAEFLRVLQGICKQTKSFKDECTSLVNEYYPIIYNFLVNDLNGTVICSMVGICDRPGFDDFDKNAPIAPLLTSEAAQKPILYTSVNRIGSVQILEQPKITLLPIERVMPLTLTLMGNTELCTFCEYFLHFVQQAITDPKTEDSIKKIIDHACEHLPGSVNQTCRQFVDTYGPAFIAILAQEIDPSVVCPKLSLCPSLQTNTNIEVFMHHVKGDKPNCPMCLLAVESLEQMVKNKKTEANLKQALSNLCSHLHGTVATECKDFVNAYTERIVEACLAQLTPEEVCVYLQVCKSNTPPKASLPSNIEYGGSVDTNEIPDSTANGKTIPTIEHSPACTICEFILTQIDHTLADNATEEEIKTEVLNVCNYLPKSVSVQCHDFINQYADLIIQLLIQELDPANVCTQLNLCVEAKKVNKVLEIIESPVEKKVGSPQCMICKMILTKIEQMLDGQVTEEAVLKAIHGVCSILPTEQYNECNQFVDQYGLTIVRFLEMAVAPAEICSLMMLCSEDIESTKYEGHSCTVCELAVEVMDKMLQNPNFDQDLEHVLEKTCTLLPVKHQPLCRGMIELYGAQLLKLLTEAAVPSTVCAKVGLCPKQQLLGGNKCTWGPGYWCSDEESARKCKMVEHCQQKVWKNKKPIK